MKCVYCNKTVDKDNGYESVSGWLHVGKCARDYMVPVEEDYSLYSNTATSRTYVYTYWSGNAVMVGYLTGYNV